MYKRQARDDVAEVEKILEANRTRLTFEKLETDTTVAKVSVVGAGMQSNAGVAGMMFEALYNVGVNIRMIATSEIRITVLIDEADVDTATKAVHDKFIED